MLHIDSQLRTVSYYLNSMNFSIARSLGIIVIFLLVCSMSRCDKEDVTPQAETVIQGVIKDPRTGEPVSNVKLVILKTWGNPINGLNQKRYDSLYTKTDGAYYLKFIPLGTGDYTLLLEYNKRTFYQSNNTIGIGYSNTKDFKIQKVVQLTVQLKYSANQNTAFFKLLIDTCCQPNSYNYLYGSSDYVSLAKDNLLSYNVPNLSYIKLTGLYRGYRPTAGAAPDSSTFKKFVNIGKADTTITILP